MTPLKGVMSDFGRSVENVRLYLYGPGGPWDIYQIIFISEIVRIDPIFSFQVGAVLGLKMVFRRWGTQGVINGSELGCGGSGIDFGFKFR